MKSFVKFVELTQLTGRKTKRWRIDTNYEHALTDVALGYIWWCVPWRCYAYYPLANTLYEKACLRDIANFCEDATDAQRKKTAETRQQPVPPPGN